VNTPPDLQPTIAALRAEIARLSAEAGLTYAQAAVHVAMAALMLLADAAGCDVFVTAGARGDSRRPRPGPNAERRAELRVLDGTGDGDG
jgi:hypothetical protein